MIDFELLQNPISENSRDIRQEIVDFDNAVKTNKLTGMVDWQVHWDCKNLIDEKFSIDSVEVVESTVIIQEETVKRFVLGIVGIRIKNEINGIEYAFEYPNAVLTNAFNVIGSNYLDVQLEETSVITDIKVLFPIVIPPGKSFQPMFEIIPKNTFNKSLKISVEDGSLLELNENGFLTALGPSGNSFLTVVADEGLYTKAIEIEIRYQLGDIGPAGGLIFYDKGDNSRGWRYLEVSTKDIYNMFDRNYDRITWRGDSEIRNVHDFIQTDTNIGAGIINTSRIASFLGGKKNAAQLCLDYEENGYDDWFLPSKDELNALVEYIGNLDGSYRTFLDGFAYWSSSLSSTSGHLGISKAWEQTVYSQIQEELEIYQSTGAIRPIRQFSDIKPVYVEVIAEPNVDMFELPEPEPVFVFAPTVREVEEVAEEPTVIQPPPLLIPPFLLEDLAVLDEKRMGLELSLGWGMVLDSYQNDDLTDIPENIFPAFSLDFNINNIEYYSNMFDLGFMAGIGYQSYILKNSNQGFFDIHALITMRMDLGYDCFLKLGLGPIVLIPTIFNMDYLYGVTSKMTYHFPLENSYYLGFQFDGRWIYSDFFKPYEFSGFISCMLGYYF